MKSIGRIVIRLGIAVVTSVLICSPLSAMTTIDFQVVDLRGVPRFRDPVYLAIRTRDEWISFTKLRGEDPPQPPTVPGQILTPIPQPPVSEIDFDRYSLLVIGIGGRTGYSVSVQQVREMGNELWVQYVVLRPGNDCAVAQVYVHPYVTVLIPQTNKPVRFNEVAAAIDCSDRKSSSEMRELLGKE
jgi:PrcB C-terminal